MGLLTQTRQLLLYMLWADRVCLEAAGGVVQGAISDLRFDFHAYADKHFARLEAAAGDPRLKDWLRGVPVRSAIRPG